MPPSACVKAAKLGATVVSHTAATPGVILAPLPPPPPPISAGDAFLIAHYESLGASGFLVTTSASPHPWIVYESGGDFHAARADLANRVEILASISNKHLFLRSGGSWIDLGSITSERPWGASGPSPRPAAIETLFPQF
jgi:hypothetical protein